MNALGEAALLGDTTILESVLAAHAKPDTRFQKGWTALFIAIHADHFEAVKTLLDSGADPSLRDENGMTARDLAVFEGRADIAKILPEK